MNPYAEESKVGVNPYGARRRSNVTAGEGKLVTQTAFLVCEDDIYVRITVENTRGRCADSNAYFDDQLL